MKYTQMATVALLITALAVPMATAATPTADTPEAQGSAESTRTTSTATTSNQSAADRVEQARTDVEDAVEKTPIPTPPPDSQFARDRGSSGNQSEPERGERIEEGLILLNSSYTPGGGPSAADVPGEWGTVTLTLRAESTKAVTLVDAGSFQLGGTLPDRTLDPFEGTKTFEFTVYRPAGSDKVGVTIVTSKTMYAEPIQVQPSGPDLPQIPTLMAIIMGISSVAVGMVGLDRHLDRKEGEGVMRVE